MVTSLHYTRAFISFLTILFISLQLTAAGQQTNTGHIIHLKRGDVVARPNATEWLDKRTAAKGATPAVQEAKLVLIHFTALPTPEQKSILTQSGITLLDYLPDNTYSALVQPNLVARSILSTPVYTILDMQPEWKADDYVWSELAAVNGNVQLLVSFHSVVTPAAIKQFITANGGQITPGPMEQYGAYKVQIDAGKIHTIAQWYGILYISPLTEIMPLDLQSRPVVKGNLAVASLANGGYGLTGDSVTVGVGDNASGVYHADMKDRITNFNPVPVGNHGTHVNGIVGGAGIIDPSGVGMATKVSLVNYLYDMVLPATGAMYKDFNMTVTNNSYGILLGSCSYSGTYDVYSHMLDTISIQYPDVLHVFASGNDGGMDCPPYPKGFATVGGGYQPAKNNVVVGSITDLLYDSPDESRGPVKDGRLKPEIVAVGLGAYSTIGEDKYGWAAGTSMASPQVAGGLALITQRYKQMNAGRQPRADLLKTILLNGAMDLGNPGPDYTYGYGSMDVYRSLQIIDKGNYSSNTVENGKAQLTTITVPANTAQLKVMLCWHDIPASPSSSKQLVNDLDLTVTTPGGITHLPLVPDHTPANVNSTATEKADHLNNTEQVTINNPLAGTYTINTVGYSIPTRTQQYALAYDIIPKGLQLTYPIGGEQLTNLDTIRVFWNTISDGNTFTVQFSSDNGGAWTTLSNNVGANTRFLSFLPPTINSGNCMVRIQRNNTGEVMTSARFSINTPPVATLDTAQCPGYVSIHWSAVPNATSYLLLAKRGQQMQVDGTATDTTYTFSRMSLTEKSYVAVQPIIDGIPGFRSVAAITIANSGNCTKPISAGDIMIEQVLSPTSGRMFTSIELGATSTMQLKLRNLYTADCNNYTVAWQVNGGTWQQVSTPATIPANGSAVVNIPGVSLGATGRYDIHVAINNLDISDPQKANDTTRFTVLSLHNDPIDLSTQFIDDFEAMPKFSVTHDSIGMSPNEHWDFANTNDTGRMRSFANDDINIGGSRSVSLDDKLSTRNGSKNTFTGTFNLGGYDTANTEVRIDFDYLLHSIPKTQDGNVVTARGNDTAPWKILHSYDLSAYPGNITTVRSLSLTDVLSAAKTNFSTSTQISFGQHDTTLIAAQNYGAGLTLDNFKIYTVTNDASIVSVVSPASANCGLPPSVPLTIMVRNGVANTLYDVRLFYSLDGGPVYTGTIDSIKGKSNVNYTFSKQLDISSGVSHSLNVWLSKTGDSYPHNDTLLNYHIRSSQIISTYPYLENFENGDGGYYSDGIKSSWQYGKPATAKVNRAASGAKAWKTNLTGTYNNLEVSYLYSPCFDISQLKNPVLSFSAALDIENCGGAICDAAFVEYSFDGAKWRKLGMRGQGTNWYDSLFNVWNTQGDARWHVATIPIPVLGLGQTTHFRFVMYADPGANFDGFAIDDIHVYDLENPIATSGGVTAITQETGRNERTDFLSAGNAVAAIDPGNEDLKNTEVVMYAHDTIFNPSASQITLERNYAIKSQLVNPGNVGIRLYLTDSEIVHAIKDTTCPSCAKLTDAYSLGITQYRNSAKPEQLNGSLRDDTGGTFSYIPYTQIKWVPYDRGYYAEFQASPRSEFWFNNGGPTGNFQVNQDYLNFLAYRNGQHVSAYWYSLIDTAVNTYTLQRSNDGKTFVTISDTPSRRLNPGQYSYSDPVEFGPDSVFYYRLRWTMSGNNTFYYSPTRRIAIDDSGATLVTLNAQMIDHNRVRVNWASFIDPVAHYYKLERAIGNREYTIIANTNALHQYGQQYNVADDPGNDIKAGTLLHYRLTVILNDGNEVVLPIQTVEWLENNSVLNVYPNPNFDGNFKIDWNADAGTTMHVTLIDAIGRTLYESTAIATTWYNTTTLQTPRGPKGVYFARIDIGGRRYTAKVVYE